MATAKTRVSRRTLVSTAASALAPLPVAGAGGRDGIAGIFDIVLGA